MRLGATSIKSVSDSHMMPPRSDFVTRRGAFSPHRTTRLEYDNNHILHSSDRRGPCFGTEYPSEGRCRAYLSARSVYRLKPARRALYIRRYNRFGQMLRRHVAAARIQDFSAARQDARMVFRGGNGNSFPTSCYASAWFSSVMEMECHEDVVIRALLRRGHIHMHVHFVTMCRPG